MIHHIRSLLFVMVFASLGSAFAQTDIQTVLADPARPEEDRVRDAGRRPEQVLEFFGVGPGAHVADLLAGGGYYTRILVPVVGPDGAVYAGNNPFFQRFGEEAMTALLSQPGFENVHRIDGPVDEVALPMDGSLDVVMVVLAYHDLWLTDEDRTELNRRVIASLKPDGVYGIIDHHADAGAGTSVIESLHRIEESVIVDEITAAGFVLAARGDFLSNPNDDRAVRIFDPSIRGQTDRFVLRFEKP